MRALIGAVALLVCLAHFQMVGQENGSRIVLPNPHLLRCKSSDCFQLWLERPAEPNAVFPKQLVIDMNQNCLYGMTVLYDKSIPLDDVKAAIDERYGKWAVAGLANSRGKIWRVEPEKFAIQLSIADKKDEKMNIAEAGTKRAIYIAFGGRTACDIP